MSSALPATRPSWYAQPSPGLFDEMLAADGEMRGIWRPVVEGLEQIGDAELNRRGEQADRMLREDGIALPGDEPDEGKARPWALDPLPLVLAEEEWNHISRGLIQRARLLNEVVADLYGSQRLLHDGLVPADMLFGHPAFRRPFHDVSNQTRRFLYMYAADLARDASGSWHVMADRTDSPAGCGYALENRILISRMLPGLIHQCRVERMAPFFLTLRGTLQRLARTSGDDPRIVVWSSSRDTAHGLENAYLARYLGYPLLESADLTVRNDRVYMKTLSGLQQVHVILRRTSDAEADPLEIDGDPDRGVAGLLQAIRAGNVEVANALGSSLIESPAFMTRLPQLCRELLREELLLPSIPTRWYGDVATEGEMGGNFPAAECLRPAFRVGRKPAHDVPPADSGPSFDGFQYRPEQWICQQPLPRSSVPVWGCRDGTRFYLGLRVFLTATTTGYQVLPGGLVRAAADPGRIDGSFLAADYCKDGWVLTSGPVPEISLLPNRGGHVELRRGGAELPSRVADHLFWFGRNLERAEGGGRLLRAVLTRLTGELEPASVPELPVLCKTLAATGQIEPGFVVEGIREQLPALERALPAAVLDPQQVGSLRSLVTAIHRQASQLRDRISLDSWRIVHRLWRDLESQAETGPHELSDVLELVNRLLIDLASLSGLISESMTRTLAWRFLELGRRIDRTLFTVGLIQHIVLDEDAMQNSRLEAVLEAVLETADSLMTYRSRYMAGLDRAPALDLLLTDETNPRSVAFQLASLAEHVDALPRDGGQPLRGQEQRIAMALLNNIRQVDLETLCEPPARDPSGTRLTRLLGMIGDQLPRLANLLSHQYLVHAGVPRPMGERRSGSRP